MALLDEPVMNAVNALKALGSTIGELEQNRNRNAQDKMDLWGTSLEQAQEASNRIADLANYPEAQELAGKLAELLGQLIQLVHAFGGEIASEMIAQVGTALGGPVGRGSGITGLDFYRLTSDASAQFAIVDEFITQFVALGYSRIPDRAALTIAIEALIREDGLADEPLGGIVLRAAVVKGMEVS